ncbi:MAG: heme lyase CcmF/NrfE family subunit [Candidatus Limnocylindrales bacterium]
MIAEVGFGGTFLGLGAAIMGLVVAALNVRGGWPITPAIRAAYVAAIALVGANVVMVVGLLAHDFSISYVAQVGSRSTPLLYTITSLWSALQGSILFWTGLQAALIAIVARRAAGRDRQELGRTLLVLFGILGFFAFVVLGPGNPWALVSPVPSDGPGPNPLLANHPLVAIHPPLLYLGFVGLSVPFALTIAALSRGRLDERWLAGARRWTFLPWVALSAGLVLGGLWSYAVLGWGGYWAWDPVENVALLPWLTATAFLHSSMVTGRRGKLPGWNVGLIVSSFVLTILATLVTRSGVLESVHSFTESSLGPLFLLFLTVVAVGSVALAGLRLPATGPGRPVHGRGTAILLNNLVLMVVAATILFGTIYPILAEAINGQQVSVGAPFFDQVVLPLAIGLLVLVGIGPTLPWGTWTVASRRRLLPGGIAAVAASISLAVGGAGPTMVAGGAAGAFALVQTAALLVQRSLALARARPGWRGARRSLGGLIAHAGAALMALAILASATGGSDVTASVGVGQSIAFGRDQFVFDDLSQAVDATGRVVVRANGRLVDGSRELAIAPSLTELPAGGAVLAGPAIVAGPFVDLYVTLINIDESSAEATIRVARYPFLSWLWIGGTFLVLGGILAGWPGRVRPVARHPAPGILPEGILSEEILVGGPG